MCLRNVLVLLNIRESDWDSFTREVGVHRQFPRHFVECGVGIADGRPGETEFQEKRGGCGSRGDGSSRCQSGQSGNDEGSDGKLHCSKEVSDDEACWLDSGD